MDSLLLYVLCAFGRDATVAYGTDPECVYPLRVFDVTCTRCTVTACAVRSLCNAPPHRIIFGLPLQIVLAFVAVFLCSFFYT